MNAWPGLAHDRHAAEALHGVDGVPGEARVVDDARAGLFGEERLGQQADDVVALDERALRVVEEAAVVVAVPGDADIGAGFAQRLERGPAVFFEHGVGHALREVAVRLVPHLDELERQMRLEFVHGEPGAAIARVHHHLELAQRLEVHVTQQVLDVLVRGVELSHLALHGRRRRQFAARDHRGDVLEAGVRADGLALLAHQLEAVVVGRIVAGGHHDAAVQLPGEGGEVHAFGAAQADVEHVDAGIGEAADEFLGELVAGEADVAAHRDASSASRRRRRRGRPGRPDRR